MQKSDVRSQRSDGIGVKVQAMNASPDDEGCFISGSVGLGFGRLSIIG